MEYVLIIGLPIAIGAYGVVMRLISKSYHRGWLDGFDEGYYIGIKFDRKMTENAKEYAEIIRKDGDAD